MTTTSDKLNEIYTLCTELHIAPHNSSIPSDVTISGAISIKHPKRGSIHYSKINISESSLDLAIDSLHYLVIEYKKLVEQMP